jgi:hypothetical protein
VMMLLMALLVMMQEWQQSVFFGPCPHINTPREPRLRR